MVINPIQGRIRGEAIIDGDASEGVEMILYSVGPSWGAISPASGLRAWSAGPNRIRVTGGAPFVGGMIGKTITFAVHGATTIVNVWSRTEIEIEGHFPLMADEAFSLAGEEGLRAVTRDDDDILFITDVFLSQEKDSEYVVVEDTDAPGQRLIKGRLLEMGSVNLRFETPFVCRPGKAIKYFGHDTGLNVCVIHGYIT